MTETDWNNHKVVWTEKHEVRLPQDSKADRRHEALVGVRFAEQLKAERHKGEPLELVVTRWARREGQEPLLRNPGERLGQYAARVNRHYGLDRNEWTPKQAPKSRRRANHVRRQAVERESFMDGRLGKIGAASPGRRISVSDEEKSRLLGLVGGK